MNGAAMWGNIVLAALRLALASAMLTLAAPAAADVTFSLRTGEASTNTQSMALDSNQCPAQGPTAAYVGGIVANSGPSAVTDISVSLGGLGGGFALSSGQAATQFIGTLAPGESIGVYWYLSYGCTDGMTTAPVVSISSSLGPRTTTLTLVARSAISANAGGNVQSATLGAGAVVGQTIHFDTAYSFGGSAVNDEIILQPSGAPATFNAACFRLVGSTILSSNITPIVAGTQNQLYFRQTVKQSGTGYSVSVRYFFQYLCANASTTARPYALQTSGSSNIKYTGNFDGAGSVALNFPGASNPFVITKSASSTIVPSGSVNTVTYTITVSNPSIHASTISSVTDTLPAGVAFGAISAGSGITAANSSSIPAAGAIGTLMFRGKLGQSYALPAGGSVSLVYTAMLPATAGTYVNGAYAGFGSATTTTAQATVNVVNPAPLEVTKVSAAWSDPVNGLANPKLIPGAVVAYTVAVRNPNGFAIDGDSAVVTDPTPAGLALFVGDLATAGSGPVGFADGAPASALSYSFTELANPTDDVEFSNDGGVSWGYAPVPGGDGIDAAVTHLRIRPKGAMASGSTITLRFRYRVE